MRDFNTYLKEVGEVGYIEQTLYSLCYANGLPRGRPYEIVLFESGEIGQITTLKPNAVEILVFSHSKIKVGTKVVRTDTTLSLPVSEGLLGQTINPLGFVLDGKHKASPTGQMRPIDIAPSGIETRRIISRSCQTGVCMVDFIVPLGRGQRELVLGDRKTGKTHFTLQAMLTQARLGAICVFAAIGQNSLSIKKVQAFLAKNNIQGRAVIVATSSQDPAGMIYLTPYTAMTIAEYFRDQGNHVILIMDDLTTHAKFYREIALLGKRFPGRNSYPSDIFYMHAKLLERAGNFKSTSDKSSITCLAIVETILGDITGYIQTNLMSITDGHIFFDSELFYKGRRPAIHPFLSVTRIGRQTQSSLKHSINREIMSALTLYEKTQRFARFGAELNEGSRLALALGEYVVGFFQQGADTVIAENAQIFSFAMLWNGLWKDKSIEIMKTNLATFNNLYGSDEKIRRQIDTIIETSATFNDLLRNSNLFADKLLGYLGAGK